jgi:hypothetical protein
MSFAVENSARNKFESSNGENPACAPNSLANRPDNRAFQSFKFHATLSRSVASGLPT